ncbi:MAG: SEL1-like repeat protein [Holophagaceae bacterium]|uniref:SEL1-like repeat protein n=1 Tax=Candidatus Geothrix odensensis TaxID=2954440 RepID=A0A936F4C7_9BACT|nr:SEL1-like repeat protein [Candidatus Geothrix odensensis]
MMEGAPCLRRGGRTWGNPGHAELGGCLEKGLGGPRDIDQALIWYKKAMEKGDDQARSAYLRLTMPPPVVDDLDDLPVADPIEDPD